MEVPRDQFENVLRRVSDFIKKLATLLPPIVIRIISSLSCVHDGTMLGKTLTQFYWLNL